MPTTTISPITATIPAFTVTPVINTPTFPEDIDVYNTELPDVIAGQSSLTSQLNTFIGQVGALEANVVALEASTLGAADIAAANANFKGTWVGATSYAVPSSVYYNGEYFIALSSSSNQTPNPLAATAYWAPYSIAFQITNATAKTTPVDADVFGFLDSAASMILKKLTWANLKTTIFASKPSGQNLLINSNGLINQRGYVSGTATTAANQYTIDMFRVVTSGQNLTFTTTNGVTIFTAPTGGVDLPIENKNIIGGSYVLTIGGTATAVVSQSADNVTYTNVTPVSGVYTITGGNYVRVRLSGGTFSKPKFEEGVIITPYSLPIFGGEVQACQRYLRPLDNVTAIGQCLSTTTSSMFLSGLPMRVTPTLSTTSGFALTAANGANLPVTSISVFGVKPSGEVVLSCTCSGGGLIAGNATYLNTASGYLTAEL